MASQSKQEKGEDMESITFPCRLFFYGTLQDHDILSSIVGRTAVKPVLRPATIKGWKLMRWSDYPTLIPGADGQVIKGQAWECPSLDKLRDLQAYESQAYHLRPCTITLETGEVLDNCHVFVWAGALDDPELFEGTFDLAYFQQYRKGVWLPGC